MSKEVGDNLTVATTSGKLRGKQEDGLFVFRGIPYAAPPTGQLRWMPPQPVEPSRSTRDASKSGPISPQNLMPAGAMPGQRQYPEEPQAEDCLFLNIWTPKPDNERRAVMVWIHGGAFTNGSGSSPMHPAGTLAKRGQIVVVSINYRLGALGFLNLNDVTGGKTPVTGNQGLLDQVAALRWVHDNIKAFGGDPDNVTVFGESAGAISVGCLLAMPAAKGLFKKAILQSGSNTCRTLPQSVEAAKAFLSVVGVTEGDVDALRALPVKKVLEAQQRVMQMGIREATFPVTDGKILPQRPLDVAKAGYINDVTVLAGGNLNEGTLFGMMDPGVAKLDEAGLIRRVSQMVPPERAAGLVQQYRAALTKRGKEPTPADIHMAIQGDKMFRVANSRLVDLQREQGMPSFCYVLEWKAAVPGLGACHGLDVGLIFGSTSKEFHGSGETVDRLSGQMQDAWIAFAKTGDPSTPRLAWPTYGPERNTMLFGERSHVEKAPYEAERAAWDGLDKFFG